MKFTIIVIFVLCIFHYIYCTKPNFHNFCAKFSANNHQFEITETKLTHGIWIQSPNENTTEVPSPQGKRFGMGATEYVYVCSARHGWVPSGIEGYITISPQFSNDQLRFEWNFPYIIGSEHYGFTYIDRAKYDVIETPISGKYDRGYNISVKHIPSRRWP